MADLWTGGFVIIGCLFYVAGTIGVLRFPDLRSRLHALTKADTVGLGLITLGLLPQVSGFEGAKLLLVWVLALAAAAVIANLIAGETADGR